MEKSLVWYGLTLKQNMKRPATWLMLTLMLALLWIVGNIHMPDGSNQTIMVCYQESAYEQEIVNLLEGSKTEFTFITCENVQEVYDAVEAG